MANHSGITHNETANSRPEVSGPGEKVELDKATYDALMDVAQKLNLNVNNGEYKLNQTELDRVNSVLQSTQETSGLNSSALSSGSGLSAGVQLLSDAGIGPSNQEAPSHVALSQRSASGVIILPRLSEYRVGQVEKAASGYEKASHSFWNSPEMSSVKDAIDQYARDNHLSTDSVIKDMRSDDRLAGLREKFDLSVSQSAEAKDCKKSMDKSLDGWLKQYGRAQEELLSSETAVNPQYDGLKQRLESSYEKMSANTGQQPAFSNGEYSHGEKMERSIEQISQKTQKIASQVENMIAGKPIENENGGNKGPEM